jgi:hypothetical protein
MKWLSVRLGRLMITITIEDDEDVTTLFNIMLEMKNALECISGECDHKDDSRDEQ